jgi:hypothetical protein
MNQPLTKLEKLILDNTDTEITVDDLGNKILPVRFLFGRDWKKLDRELSQLHARGLLVMREAFRDGKTQTLVQKPKPYTMRISNEPSVPKKHVPSSNEDTLHVDLNLLLLDSLDTSPHKYEVEFGGGGGFSGGGASGSWDTDSSGSSDSGGDSGGSSD